MTNITRMQCENCKHIYTVLYAKRGSCARCNKELVPAPLAPADDQPTKSAPRRACSLMIDVHGDTRDDVVRSVEEILESVKSNATAAVFGGVSAGYSFTYSEKSTPTHDEYVAQLKEYLDKGDKDE